MGFATYLDAAHFPWVELSDTPTCMAGTSAAGVALQERLVAACTHSSFLEVVTALADGASVNTAARRHDGVVCTPLRAALHSIHTPLPLVVHLLARGADVNGPGVMWAGAMSCSRDVLQLLIDAGGSVNAPSLDELPLHIAVVGWQDGWLERIELLLSQPSVDVIGVADGRSIERRAWTRGASKQVVMLRAEVRLCRLLGPLRVHSSCQCRLSVMRSRRDDARRDNGAVVSVTPSLLWRC